MRMVRPLVEVAGVEGFDLDVDLRLRAEEGSSAPTSDQYLPVSPVSLARAGGTSRYSSSSSSFFLATETTFLLCTFGHEI